MDEREFQYYLHFRAADMQRRAARERLIYRVLQEQWQNRGQRRPNLLKQAWLALVGWWGMRRPRGDEPAGEQSPECPPPEALNVMPN